MPTAQLPLVLSELVVRAGRLRPAQRWRRCRATDEELRLAEREAAHGDRFDRLGLKRGLWNAWRQGDAELQCWALGSLARVVCFLPRGTAATSLAQTLEFWAKIFQWFGPAAVGGPWRVIWFAAPSLRQFPMAGQDLGAEHVNGGYTRPCSTEGIFIYRAEEATRVLIHEMMHAACLDEVGAAWSIPLREAMVEVWAELLLVALRSGGDVRRAAALWAAQAQWVANTNWKAAALHGTHDISDYAWRYLTGREVMFARLGVALPAPQKAVAARQTSVRFTCAELGA